MEILIVLAILGLISTVLFAAYTGTLDVAAEVEERGDMGQMARGALSLFQQDLRTVWLAPKDEEEAESRFVFTSEEENTFTAAEQEETFLLRFATTNVLDFSGSFPRQTIAEVRYVFRRPEDAATGSLFRVQRSNPELANGGQEMEIADGLTEVSLEFVDENGMASEDFYGPESADDPMIPALVQITLTIMNPDGRQTQYGLTTHPQAVVQEKE